MYAADHGFSECVLLLLGYVSTLVSIVWSISFMSAYI
jgi:hypothetical protein